MADPITTLHLIGYIGTASVTLAAGFYAFVYAINRRIDRNEFAIQTLKENDLRHERAIKEVSNKVETGNKELVKKVDHMSEMLIRIDQTLRNEDRMNGKVDV